MAGIVYVLFLVYIFFIETLLTGVSAIHGDKQQTERDWVLNEFKTGKSPIMVATDVASRGIGMMTCNSPFHQPHPPPILESLTRIDVV